MDLGRRNKVKAEGGMSSMTDLVFLMMIFFIIMSTMSNNTLPVELPENADSSTSPTDAIVEIGIAENSMYFFDSDKSAFYSYEEMEPILKAKMDKEPLKNLKITGDKVANYEAVFKVIALAKMNEWKPVLTFQM